MSFKVFESGVSGLLAYQAALSTTSHNIANAATEGYSRQQVQFAARPGQFVGAAFIGSGTELSGIRRVYDQFLAAQVFANVSAFHRLDTFSALAAGVDNLLADGENGAGAQIQALYDAFHSLSADPDSIPVRQALLGEAQALVDRFRQTDSRLRELEQETNGRLQASVGEINALAQGIADINEAIVRATSSGASPNDLLDQRELLVQQLNEHVEVSTLVQDDGALNVFIGNGLVLVRGSQAETLGLVPNSYDPARMEVSYSGLPGNAVVSGNLHGGAVGGLLDFRREVLDPARNEIGMIALGFVDSLNAQHREGMTLLGELGGDFFAIGAPAALAASGNAGTAAVTVSIADLGALEGREYRLVYDGAAWDIRDPVTGQPVPFSGSGTAADPFLVEGVAIEVGAGAAAGDSFLIRPTANAIPGMSLLIDDARDIAAAAPIHTLVSGTNTGNASISSGEVLDATDPNLLDTVTIAFVDPGNYTINGAGPFPYTSGQPIDFNGWRVEISGNPAAGDTFTVQSNSGGTGDNRNALELADLQSLEIFQGGTATVADSYDSLVTAVGTSTRQATLNRDAQSVLLVQAETARQAVSGVNLDEEAANLLRWEQAYAASAEVVRIANEVFQTLLGVLAR